MDLFPCDLLFIHRDAEAEPHDVRRAQIGAAVAEAFDNQSKPAWVGVIPVRMREAWLLFDETAIRRAAGNPSGQMALDLPSLHRCEDLPNPKAQLDDILRKASGLGARRQSRLRVSPMTRRVADYIADFSPLRALRAFKALESELQEAISANGWRSP